MSATAISAASEDETRPNRRRPVQRRSVERYERILNACAALLDEGGYSGMSTTAVAKRAEVPIGTLYQFFADKDALIQALAERNLERYLERLSSRFAAETPSTVRAVVDLAVEEFVGMRRTVPGFGVVDFGAGGSWDGPQPDDEHVLDQDVDNNTAVARRMRSLTQVLLGDEAGTGGVPEIAVRVALECADAVLKLAFREDPDGDPVLIAECKRVLHAYLCEYQAG
jgi:AcrR family transcriptional regulator